MSLLFRKDKRLFSWLFLIAAAHNCLIVGGQGQSPRDEDALASAIKRLCSSSEKERQTAKDEIARFGRKAIPPLLSVLEVLSENLLGLSPKSEGREGSDSGFLLGLKESKCYTDPKLNWEVNSDVCELLGQLQAVEAVPILLRIMDERETINHLGAVTFDMKALVSIGDPAVPQILEFFESADLRAESIKFGGPQPSLEVQTRYKQGHAATARARAAIVLAEIGDIRALPVLEQSLHLSTTGAWRPDVPYIKEAISKIKDKNKIRYSIADL